MTAQPNPTGLSSLAFLGAGLSSGRGVGDYTLQLTASLTKTGHQCVVLDRRQHGWDDFVKTARATMATHRSQWVILQFVAYSWGWQGLINKSVMTGLREICAGHKVAIYFHELWIGEEIGASLQHRLIGGLQRKSILKLLHSLAPHRVMTSNTVYQAILAREGWKASRLSLPGNLPLPTDQDKVEADTWMTTHGLVKTKDTHTIAVVFGTIHQEGLAVSALAEWVSHAQSQNKKAILLTLGIHGPQGKQRLTTLQASLPSLRLITAGKLSSGLIAAFLLQADLAFATSPWALIEKSGTVAAFRDFGIPVVVPRDNWKWRRDATPRPLETPDLRPWAPHFDWASTLASKKPVALSIDRAGEELLAVLNSEERDH